MGESIRCFLIKPTGAEAVEQGRSSRIYERADGESGTYVLGSECAGIPTAPAGAMWFATWYDDLKPGGMLLCGKPADGWLVVRLPNGDDWMPDTRAKNCTLPNDDAHRCWVRHGEAPNFTVDKSGVTCSAGAGSIAMGSGGRQWHGFLRQGMLVQ